MLVQSVNNLNATQFGHRNHRRDESSSALPAFTVGALTTGAAAGTAAYFLVPSKVNVDQALKMSKDEFSSTFNSVSKKNQTGLKNLRAMFSNMDSSVEKQLEESFGAGDKPVSVDAFIKLVLGDKKASRATLKADRAKAEKALEKALIENHSATISSVFESNDSKRKAHEASVLSSAKSAQEHSDSVLKYDHLSEFIEAEAKKGKISRESVAEFLQSAKKREILSKTSELLKGLGDKLPKAKSLKNASLVAGIVALFGGILSATIFSSNNN